MDSSLPPSLFLMQTWRMWVRDPDLFPAHLLTEAWFRSSLGPASFLAWRLHSFSGPPIFPSLAPFYFSFSMTYIPYENGWQNVHITYSGTMWWSRACDYRVLEGNWWLLSMNLLTFIPLSSWNTFMVSFLSNYVSLYRILFPPMHLYNFWRKQSPPPPPTRPSK